MDSRFLFHAEAVGASGIITSPNPQTIEVQAASALPSIGGSASATVTNFSFKGSSGNVLSFSSAYTQTLGSRSPDGQAYVTLVSSTVEGLNILDMITADRIVARINSRHPIDHSQPSIILLGSHFENLRIGGHPVDVDLAIDVFDQYDTLDKLNEAWKKDEALRALLGRTALAGPAAGAALPMSKGALGCTLVRGLASPSPQVRLAGASIPIAQFGTLHLAELFVSGTERNLTMLRAEMGTPPSGSLSVASAKGNGDLWP